MAKSRRSSQRRLPPPTARRAPSARVLLVGAVAIGATLLVVAAFASSLSTRSYACGEVTAVPASDSEPAGITMDSRGGGHVPAGTKITYAACPPTSGLHFAAAGAGPLRPGFYSPDGVAQPGGWVHNLEHGFAVVLYRGEPDADTLADLRAFVGSAPQTASAAACGYPSKTLVARFDDLSTPFAALAWDRLLPLADWDETAARAFAERSIDATAPEPSAC